MNIVCPSCKALHWMDEKLFHSSRSNPKFGMCCFSGKMDLPVLHALPEELHQLYHGQDDQAKSFRKNIRRYNNALAMTSVGQSPGVSLGIDHTINNGHGPWLYKVKGALHHFAGSLETNPGTPPRYAQLYIYDPADALDLRMNTSHHSGLNHGTMQKLQDMLYRKHPSVAKFKQAYEQLKDNPAENAIIRLRFDKGCDRRRYNLPTAASNEIAVILPGDGDQEQGP